MSNGNGPTHADIEAVRRQVEDASERTEKVVDKLSERLGETNERLAEVGAGVRDIVDRIDRRDAYTMQFQTQIEQRLRAQELSAERRDEAMKSLIQTVAAQGSDIGRLKEDSAAQKTRFELREGQAAAVMWATKKFWGAVAVVSGIVAAIGGLAIKAWAAVHGG